MPGGRRRVFTLGLAVLSALAGKTTLAESLEHTVLLSCAASQSELCDRTRTELTLGGWLVVEMPEGARGPTRVPDEVARHVNATVAMRVEPGSIELWVVDPETSSTVHHETITTDASQGVDVVSLRIVEVLRARLLKLGVPLPKAPASPSSSAPSPEPGPPPAAAPPEPREPQRPAVPSTASPELDRGAARRETSTRGTSHVIDVGAAPLLAWSPGGVGWTAEAVLDAHYVANHAWAIGASLALPVASASVVEQQGTVTVRWGWVGAVAERRFVYRGGALAIGGFAGLVGQRLTGEANLPYRNGSDWIATAAFLGSAGASFDVSDSLRLRLDGSAGLAAPRPVVMVADRAVASWGRPLLLVSLGIQWDVWQSRSGERVE